MNESAIHAAAYCCRPSMSNTRWHILGVNSETDGTYIRTHYMPMQPTQSRIRPFIGDGEKASSINAMQQRVMSPLGKATTKPTDSDTEEVLNSKHTSLVTGHAIPSLILQCSL